MCQTAKERFLGQKFLEFLTIFDELLRLCYTKNNGGGKMTYTKPFSWRDFPNTPGKHILEEILSTPRPDFTQLDKDVAAYEKKRSNERKSKAAKNK